MKLERQFWTDAMRETVRPHIDCKVVVEFTASDHLNTGMASHTNWQTYNTPANFVNSTNSLYYHNMLNGNGFKVGDGRCLLTKNNGSSNKVYSCAAITSVGTTTTWGRPVNVTGTADGSKRFPPSFFFHFFNFKKVDITIDAKDDTNPLNGNTIDTATINIDLADYVDDYIASYSATDLFPNWNVNTYLSVLITFTVPNGDRIFLARPRETYIWNTEDIVKIENDENLELISGELPSQTMRVTHYDASGDFDPTNPNSLYAKFRENEAYVSVWYLVNGASMLCDRLRSLRDATYSKHQFTLECDTKLQSLTGESFINLSYLPTSASVGNDLPYNTVWTDETFTDLSSYVTNVINKDKMSNKEIFQLRASSIGAHILITDTEAYKARQATELKTFPAEDFHIRATDIKDTYATLEQKPLLGVIRVSKYRYYITSEYEQLQLNHATKIVGKKVQIDLPDWCKRCAKLDAVGTYPHAYDEDGTLWTNNNLSYTINIDAFGQQYIVISHNDPNIQLTDGSMYCNVYYWAEEASKTVVEEVNSNGEECAIDNPFVTTDAQVKAVIDSVKYVYGHRDVFTAQWAQDWRVELGDIVYLDTQFESNVKCVVTGLKFSYPGLWGEITMRRLG